MLSVLIPARNEFLLRPTIETTLKAAKGEIEVIAVLDGYWPDPNIIDDPRVTLIHHTKPIGQRAAINEAARIAKGKYILKTDAHSMFDEGFDVKLAQDCEYDWTVLPRMYNLHAFDHVCENGHRFYQDKFDYRKENVCPECQSPLKTEYVWKPRLHKKTDFMYIDSNLVVKYWYKYAKRPEAKGDIVDVMNGVGACWFQHRDRFLELGGLDEKHGGWGQVGVEIALKAWLSGGRHVVNRKTWFAHMFRTTKDFGFPYEIRGKDQEKARKYSRNLWQGNNWPLAKRPFNWVLEKFQPIPSWELVKPEKKLLLSVIIPARNEIYLQRTIDDCLKKLKTDFEIIIGLDNYTPDPPLKKDPRVIIYKSENRIGMRPMINKMARMANGKYLMRLDAHCIVAEGVDKALIDCYQSGDTVLAMRYEVRSKDWTRRDKTDCPYRYLSHPDVDEKGGLRGLAWPEYAESHKDEQIGETMTISGSNWLMEKSQFLKWGGLDEKHGTFGQEGVEISCMTWLSGGKVLVNKNTWYAHWNRGKSSYSLGANEKKKSMERSIHLWMGDNWPRAKRKFQWLIDHFAPVPGWPICKYDYHFRLRTYYVDELYENFIKYADPQKTHPDNPRGTYELQRTFRPFVKSVLEGDKYTDEDLKRLPYYDYLVKHLNPAVRDPLIPKGIRHVIAQMRDAENLCKSIRDEGLKTPLDMFRYDKGVVLQRGQRRVVILKHLNIKKVSVRLFDDKRSFMKMCRSLDVRGGGNIERLAVKQFTKKGLKATDKYWKHNYTYLYDRHLNGRIKNILEIGVKRGASLLLWKKAFPKARITGIDIKDVSGERILRENKDLRLSVGSQSDRKFLKTIVDEPYDLIVDDGSHKPDDQLASLEFLWPHLSKSGWYVIEDLYGQAITRQRHPVIMNKLKSMIDKICTKETSSVLFYPNICFIQKNG